MAENRIPLKTDEKLFDKDDFIQTECGTLKEITVTITLHEYRKLLSDAAYWQQKAINAADKARQLQNKICTQVEEQFIKENSNA